MLLERGPTPIRIEILEKGLEHYPKREDAEYLQLGFKYGFRIPALGLKRAFMAKILKSIKGMEGTVLEKINKEVREGRVLGPFQEPPIDNLRVSPLGIVPKKAPREYRLIHHLSFPEGALVNDAIPGELCSV